MNPRRLLAVLAVAVAVVLLIARLLTAGPGTGDDAAPSSPATATAPAAAPGDLGGPADNPARTGSPAPGTGSPASIDPGATASTAAQPPGFDTAGAATAAARFAHDWTRHTGGAAGDWAQRLIALSTPALAGKLRAVDPATVPASSVTGTPAITATPAGADASITTDTGTLRLGLVRHGRWQVDTVDWTPAR